MTQAPTWSVPLVGPSNPTDYSQRIDESMDALLTAHSGSARPSYAVAGTIWQDSSVAGTVSFYLYIGGSDRLLYSVDTSTGALTLPDVATGSINMGGNALTNPAGEFLRNHISGLTISNNVTDATNDIDVAAGSAGSDGATPVLMTLASAITKRTDAAWAVGTGNGGWLDGASMPNGGGHVFLIERSDTGVKDIGISASLSPTLPTNYDRKHRIGWIQRAAATITPFIQVENRFLLKAVQAQYAGSGVVNVTQLIGTVGPVGIRYKPILQSTLVTSAASTAVIALGDGDAAAVVSNIQWVANDITVVDAFCTNTSGQLRHTVTTSAGTISQYSLNSVGWWDNRI